jgi:hypothetical protein
MITYDSKTGILTITDKDLKLVRKYGKEHKLTVKEVVYLAIMNGLAQGKFR